LEVLGVARSAPRRAVEASYTRANRARSDYGKVKVLDGNRDLVGTPCLNPDPKSSGPYTAADIGGENTAASLGEPRQEGAEKHFDKQK
jgi:hypothetical protein